MKKISIALMSVAVAAVLATGCAGSTNDAGSTGTAVSANKGVANNKTVFKVDSDKCTVKEAKIYLLNYQNLYGKMYGVNVLEQSDKFDQFQTYIKNMTLSQLAHTESMAGLAKQQEMTLSEEEQTNIKKAAKEYYESMSETERAYTDASESLIESMYQDYALANKIYTTLTSKVNEEVSDDEARVMHVMQIVVADQDTAKKVKKALKSGSDFASVATTYNEADKIECTIARGDLPEAAEEAAFALEDGQTTKGIETDQGYYFIYCVSKFDAELTDSNKTVIAQKRREEAFDNVYNDYISSVSAEVNTKIWDQVTLDTIDEMTTDSFFTVYDKNCGE